MTSGASTVRNRLSRIAGFLIVLLLAAAAVSACHGQDPDAWYGYRLGGKLDPADILGMPLAKNGSRQVTLKPKGAWPWDEATAWITPDNVIIAMEFKANECGAPAPAAPSPWAKDTVKTPAAPCSRSSKDLAAFADTLRDSIKDRVSPHTLPTPPSRPPESGPLRTDGEKAYSWLFRKQPSGCDGDHARYLAPYDDPTGTFDKIVLESQPDYVALTLVIADMWRYDSVRQTIAAIDDDTERQKKDDQCAGRRLRYVDIVRDTTSSTPFGMPQYGYMEANGYRVPPFKRAGVITNQDYDYAVGPDTLEANISWVQLTASLALDAAGTINRCTTVQSSGDLRLDDLSCRLMQRRFRFYPARDDAGAPVPSLATYKLRWPLPRSENGNAWGLDSEYGGSTASGPPQRMVMPYPHSATPINIDRLDLTAAYPPGAKARHEQGVANVDLTISTDGLPIGCTVLRSSDWPDLDEATCSFLKAHALFRPATDGEGHAIVGHFQQRVKWLNVQ